MLVSGSVLLARRPNPEVSDSTPDSADPTDEGNVLATLTIGETELKCRVLPCVVAELCRPGLRLRVVMPDGKLLSESITWAELLA